LISFGFLKQKKQKKTEAKCPFKVYMTAESVDARFNGSKM